MITQIFLIHENKINENSSSPFISIITVQGANDFASLVNYDVVKHPDDNFTIVFIDQVESIQQLGIISTTSNYQWAESIQYLAKETADYSFVGKPTITYLQDSIYIFYPFKGASSRGIELISKNIETGVITNQTLFEHPFDYCNNPLIMRNATNNGLILAWLSNDYGNYELFMTKSNTTVLDFGERIKVSSLNESSNKDCSFAMDSTGDLHFAWAYGEVHHEKIVYRTMYANSSLSAIENITDGSNRCKEPVLLIDNYDYVNLFWTNFTVENPDLQMGTVNIYSAKKQLSGGPWINYLEVAPYIPTERPPSGESDAYTPAVALDQQNRLWLAYEIREEYANHMGVDIRHRENNNWMPGTILSLLTNAALDPQLIVDEDDNLHCFWLDARHSTYEIYHRIKFSTDTWSDEVLVTFTGRFFNYIWQTALIISVVFLVMGLPFVIGNILKRRRAEKLIKGKIKDLQ